MIIAIDCDDVLIDASHYVIDTYNKTYGTRVSLASAHQSRSPEWEAEREVVFERLHAIQHSEEYAAIAPPHDTSRVVRELAKHHELHIVTARPEEVLAVTERMVEDYFPGCFASIEHVGPDASKGDICEKLGADVMIDDNVHHLVDADQHGVPHLIWYGDYPWQVDQDASVINARRCLSWSDVEKEIEVITHV